MAQALLDMVPAQQGDQLAGCSVGKASVPVVNLAGLHSSRFTLIHGDYGLDNLLFDTSDGDVPVKTAGRTVRCLRIGPWRRRDCY